MSTAIMRVAYPAVFLAMILEGAWQPGHEHLLIGGALFAAAKILKWSAILSLGDAWTFRVIVRPGVALVTAGPYRWLRHPNYVAVAGELVGRGADERRPRGRAAGHDRLRRADAEADSRRGTRALARPDGRYNTNRDDEISAVACRVHLCARGVRGRASLRRARVAQTQRRAAAPPPAPKPATPFEAATRALLEGRFDEVDSTGDKLNLNDPNVVALKARAAMERGRYTDAESLLQPVATRLPTSEAALELGLMQKLLSKAAFAQTLGRVASLAAAAQNADEMARAAKALAALDRVADAKAAFLEATRAAPTNPGIETAFGDLFLAKYNYAEALKSYERVLEIDPRWTPALAGAAHALENDDPPQAAAAIKRLLEINPNSVDANIFLAGQAADVSHHKEAREFLNKALAVNPNNIEAHGALAALAFVEDNNSAFEAEVAKVHAVAPSRRRRVPPHGRDARAQLPLRRGRGDDTPRAHACAARRAGTCRSRRAVAAHRRRAGRPHGARDVVPG